MQELPPKVGFDSVCIEPHDPNWASRPVTRTFADPHCEWPSEFLERCSRGNSHRDGGLSPSDDARFSLLAVPTQPGFERRERNDVLRTSR
jgi:hypothetical protein